jgi:hypothetical protein
MVFRGGGGRAGGGIDRTFAVRFLTACFPY